MSLFLLIFIIIAFTITFIRVYLKSPIKKKRLENFTFAFASAVLAMIISTLIILVPSLMLAPKAPAKWIEGPEILSVSTTDKQKGFFFFGCGTSDRKSIYYTYIKKTDGIHYQEFDRNKTILLEDDSQTPHIEYYIQYQTYDTIYNFLFAHRCILNHQITRTRLIIPSNTIFHPAR